MNLCLPTFKLIGARFAEQSDQEGCPAAPFLAALAEDEIADCRQRRRRSAILPRLHPVRLRDAEL